MFGLLLPSNQQAAEAVEPAVRAFDDPASGLLAARAFGHTFFAARTQVGDEAVVGAASAGSQSGSGLDVRCSRPRGTGRSRGGRRVAVIMVVFGRGRSLSRRHPGSIGSHCFDAGS